MEKNEIRSDSHAASKLEVWTQTHMGKAHAVPKAQEAVLPWGQGRSQGAPKFKGWDQMFPVWWKYKGRDLK